MTDRPFRSASAILIAMKRRWREPRFLLLIGAGLVALAGSVRAPGPTPGAPRPAAMGGRSVDGHALDERLRDGRLVKHPALFVHAAEGR